MSDIEDYKVFLASNEENKLAYECITLSHPFFTKTYYLVIGNTPIEANLPDGDLAAFEPANIKAQNAANNADLTQVATFTISDIDNVLDSELDNIPLDNTESPICAYSIYMSDCLTSPVEYIEYDVQSVPQKKGVFTLKVGAPNLNKDSTGELFTLSRFPMLRGL